MPSPVLEPGEVDVWKVCLEPTPTLAGRYEPFLNSEELERAKRFRVAYDHHCFVVYRGVLRCLLAGYLGVAPACVSIRLGDRGKPQLESHGAQRLEFSMSHTRGLALYAFSWNQEVGIDVEFVDTGIDEMRLAVWIMEPDQFAALEGLPRLERLECVYRAWVRMEAVGKAKGLGLAELTASKEEITRWRVSDLEVGSGCMAAFAVKSEPSIVRLLEWPDSDPALTERTQSWRGLASGSEATPNTCS